MHGGAGAVGSFAVQLAHLHGAYVIATVSGQDIDFVKQLSADQVIGYKATRFEEEVQDLDVVFDTVGGDTLNRSWSVLKPGGRMVTIAADSEATIDQRVKDAFFIVEPNQKQLVEVAKLLDAGKLQTFVKATVPLNEASIAYSGALKDKRGHGKIVIAVTPPDQMSDSKAKPFGQQEFLTSLAPLILRWALAVTILSAVADRFGLWGPPGAVNISWGNWSRFVAYTAKVNSFLPAAVVPELAIVATVAGSMISSGIPRHLMSSVRLADGRADTSATAPDNSDSLFGKHKMSKMDNLWIKAHRAVLANSELDLVIGYLPEPPKELIRRTRFHKPIVCVARRGHPVLHDESLSLEHYVELSHVQVLPRDATMFGDAVDTAIAAIGLIRRVVLWQPNFLAVGNVVSR